MTSFLARCAAIGLFLALCGPALAIVGGGATHDPNGIRRYTVRIEGSHGICSGTVIAPDLVLTAAHCLGISPPYRVVALDRAFRSRRIPVIAAAVHGSFVPGQTPRTQQGVDLAVLRLASPLPNDMRSVAFGAIEGVTDLSVAGFGVSSEHDRAGARTLRETALRGLAYDRQNGSTVVAVGRGAAGPRFGRGACVGDSGGPVLAGRNGSARLVGIVSWASGLPGQPSYCGGLTAAIPVADHARWIRQQAGELHRLPRGAPPPAAARESFYEREPGW